MVATIGCLLLALVVGVLGRKTFIGFWGNFIFSLFLSPLVPLIYILSSQACNKAFVKTSPKSLT